MWTILWSGLATIALALLLSFLLCLPFIVWHHVRHTRKVGR